jgi:hypothetical protein
MKRMTLRARRGQILVLVVLMIPVMVGVTGLALDTSNLLTHRDAAQNAADLAALAATIDLPGAPVSARTAAQRIAASNKHANGTAGIGVTVTTPYLGDSAQVEVKINDTVNIMFMRLFGFRRLVVTARAVATAGHALDAIYAGGGCGGGSVGGVSWTATSTNITGPIHSNGTLSMTTSGTTITGPLEYVCPPPSVSATGGSVPPPTQVAARPPGATLSYANLSSHCTTTFAGNLTITASTPGYWASPGHLNPGFICATGSITLNTAATGAVTFVAGTTFNISGSPSTLSPATGSGNVLAYANGTGTSAMAGGGGTWTGIVAAPNGSLTVNSAGTWIVNGSVIGAQVSVNGAGLHLDSSTTLALKPTLIQ